MKLSPTPSCVVRVRAAPLSWHKGDVAFRGFWILRWTWDCKGFASDIVGRTGKSCGALEKLNEINLMKSDKEPSGHPPTMHYRVHTEVNKP